MVDHWSIDGTLVVHWWYTGGTLVAHWWYTGGTLVVAEAKGMWGWLGNPCDERGRCVRVMGNAAW